jgi:transcriptional regulator with XRE-family HTH domain
VVNGSQIRAARAWLGISQEALAEKSEVSKRTVMRIEMGRQEPIFARTLKSIQTALEKEGIEFIFEDGVGVGFRTKKSGR